MRRLVPALVGLFAAAILVAARAPAETRAGSSKERRFFSARHGVGVETPPGWSLSLHTGYANVLCTLLHPGGSRISLAVDRTTVKDAAALVELSRPGMSGQGLTVDRVSPGPRGGVMIDARTQHRNQALRQLYIVRDSDNARGERQAIVITLATPTDQLAAATAPFDWVIAHLSLESPVHPDDRPDGGR